MNLMIQKHLKLTLKDLNHKNHHNTKCIYGLSLQNKLTKQKWMTLALFIHSDTFKGFN